MSWIAYTLGSLSARGGNGTPRSHNLKGYYYYSTVFESLMRELDCKWNNKQPAIIVEEVKE